MLFRSVIYLLKFYSKSNINNEGDEIFNLIYFQTSAILILAIFVFLNPINLYHSTIETIQIRKRNNEKYFYYLRIKLMLLENKFAPYIITSITFILLSIIVCLLIACAIHEIPFIEDFLKFPFQFASNVNSSKLYYAVYGFLFSNFLYIIINSKIAGEIYFLKFIINIKTIFYAFFITILFMIFNMIFYFDYQEIKTDFFVDKSKIAYAIFFNLCFIYKNYLAEKELNNVEN